MADTIFLFGGTSEGHILAETAWERWECHVFVATKEGAEVLPDRISSSARMHIGRLDAEQMAETMRLYRPCLVMDATHPYAVEVSANIRKACDTEGVRYIRVLRAREEIADGIEAGNAEEAARILQERFPKQAVLLTTGSKELPVFSEVLASNPEIYARILPGEANVEAALKAGVQREHILTGLGPFSEEDNFAVLQRYHIAVLVTKESGSRGGFNEKLHAAKRAGAEVIVIRRPVEETGITLEEANELLSKITGINK